MIEGPLKTLESSLHDAISATMSSADFARIVREHRARAWAEIREFHTKGATGETVVHTLSAAADIIVRAACEAAAMHLGNPDELRQSVAVCALGGFGRNELSPSSDLDVCLLYRENLNGPIEAANAFLVPFFWDAGFDSGYVVQSVSEAHALAMGETPMFTTYLLARPVWGNAELLASLKAGLVGRDTEASKACMDFCTQRRNRSTLAPQHAERFSQEPNLKEQAGGLRDYHVSRWMLALTFGDVPPDVLAARGVLPSDTVIRLNEGLDFLWRLRNELHWWRGKRTDILTYAAQEHVARAFDYGTDRTRAVERLMQDYYAATRSVRDFLAVVARVCHGSNSAPEPPAENAGEQDANISVRDERINAGAADPQWFAENPPRLMRVFWESARQNVPVNEATLGRINRHLHLVGEEFQANELVRRFFFAICAHPYAAGKVLRQMAECGLLGAYIPEFAAVQGMVRHQQFHSFPVGEHTIRAIEALADIPNLKGIVGRFLEKTLEHVHHPHVLIIAILFHDLGKALPGDHVDEGLQIVDTAGRRMGWDESTVERVSFLVRHHMLMNDIAMYRDTDDPAVVDVFARTMRSDERLRELVLHSYCDLRAVAPGVWTDWKGALLMKLSLKAERIMSGRDMGSSEDFWTSPRVARICESLQTLEPGLPPEHAEVRVQKHLKGFGDRYLIAFRPVEIAAHIRALERVPTEGMVVLHEARPGDAMSAISVFTQDRPRLFASLAATFAVQGAAVRSAGLFTNDCGDVVDVFLLSDSREQRPLTAAQFESIERMLRKVLLEGADIQPFVDESRRKLFAILEPPAPVATRIAFDDSASPNDTVLDIETGDRTGLLYDIAHVLSEAGLNVLSARIDTDSLRVRDAFHVQKDGKPITDPELREALCSQLLTRLEPLAAGHIQGDPS